MCFYEVSQHFCWWLWLHTCCRVLLVDSTSNCYRWTFWILPYFTSTAIPLILQLVSDTSSWVWPPSERLRRYSLKSCWLSYKYYINDVVYWTDAAHIYYCFIDRFGFHLVWEVSSKQLLLLSFCLRWQLHSTIFSIIRPITFEYKRGFVSAMISYDSTSKED
jgi:hypothetical protein